MLELRNMGSWIKIEGYFQEKEYMKSQNETSLYVKKESISDIIIICLHVDDIIYSSSSNSIVDKFKSQTIVNLRCQIGVYDTIFLVLMHIKFKMRFLFCKENMLRILSKFIVQQHHEY